MAPAPGSGGAILTTATEADAGNTPEIRLSIFRDNSAFLVGTTGGGGGAIELGHGDLFVRASHFIDNQAEAHGGAIQLAFSRLSLEIVGFVGNEAGGNGGAIESDKGCSFYSVNCLFADNIAGSEGGAAHLQRAASVDIRNATVSDNTAGNYGGFFVESSEAGCEIPLSIHVFNSIFWGNICLNTPTCDRYSRELALSMTGTTPDILVEYTDLYDLGSAPYPGGSNIDENPLFIDPSNRNWRLQVTSECIDAANGEVIPQDNDDADSDLKTICDGCDEEDNGEHLPDLDLGRRIIEVHPFTATGLPPDDDCPLECDRVPDMGAYERIACIDPEDCAAPGDLNGDTVVNGLDIQPFTWCAVYQSQAELPCLCGDFSGPAGFPDSVVDVYDIPCFIELLITGANGCPGPIICSEELFALQDCNDNDIPDANDIAFGTSLDCNKNGVPDECDLANETSNDVNSNDIPDECEPDCNSNGVPDAWDLSEETSNDVNSNDIPDECEPDCNGNDVPDGWDVSTEESDDCNENGIPDECEDDCNNNDVPDDCDIANSTSEDCNNNGSPDECDLARTILPSFDCNDNNVPDECDIANETSEDTNENGIPDECESESRGGGQSMMPGGGEGEGGGFDEEAAWDAFYEWYNEQVFGDPGDWDTLSGPDRFERVMDELELLGLPIAAPW